MYKKNDLRSWLQKAVAVLPWSKEHPVTEGGIVSVNNNLALKAFVQDQIRLPTFKASLSENDEMYLFALRSHQGNKDRACIEILSTGKQSFNVVRSVAQWKFGGLSKINSFLDFASGYGRLTRFLVQELCPENIWVCDIYKNAVRFQAEQFGVNSIVSTLKPEDYHDKRRYDYIFVASLFSHLPEDSFIGWLRRLYDLLTPEGILVFSVHDTAIVPAHLKSGDKEIVFAAESESRTLDKNTYGTTYVSETFVRDVIAKVTGKTVYHRKKRVLWSFQDVYVISKDERVDFTGLDISQGPSGYLEACRSSEEGKIHFIGWAADFSKNGSIQDVQILINGKKVLSCMPTYDRPDVSEAFQNSQGLRSGFSCNLPKLSFKSDDIILVKIVNREGMDHVLRAGDFESILDK
jgi:SAM-dependent methyltransferase